MIKKYRLRDYDFKLIVLVVAITIIGIFAIGSAKESVQGRQIYGFVLGFFLMLVISLFDYNIILKFSWGIYLANIILLALVATIGVTVGGAQRWFVIFGIQFQPSETAKIFIILFFAYFISKHSSGMNTLRFPLLCLALFLVPLILIYRQPDMSTSIIVILVFCVIMFVGGLNWKYILLIIAIMIPIVVIGLSLILQPDQEIIEDYQQNRILAWLYPDEYANAEAYQQNNSKMAIGSGQLLGKGYDTNEISSVKNGNFISEPQTDFIFAVICEEFGFIGGCTVIVLLIFISIECIIVAKKARDLSGSIIAASVGALIGMQGLINMSVATGVIPNTGIPLPFVSYGLTSLVSLYIGIGFVLNVRLQPKK